MLVSGDAALGGDGGDGGEGTTRDNDFDAAGQGGAGGAGGGAQGGSFYGADNSDIELVEKLLVARRDYQRTLELLSSG